MSASPQVQSELELVKQVQKLANQHTPKTKRITLQIGDDAAALTQCPDKLTLISTDALVEGIHFDLQYMCPEDLGWKALAVNLSDIAAMGGVPIGFTISVAVPPVKSGVFLTRMYKGMMELARDTKTVLLGGDTSASSGPVFLSVTILGDVKPTELITRKGAQPGDKIFVTGELGVSAIGLELLRCGGGRSKAVTHLISQHLRPQPRIKVGRWLATNHCASALLDISDGLSTDLSHLCKASNVGAVINSKKIPLPTLNSTVRSLVSKPLLDYSLNGGEDYELLFSVPAKKEIQVPNKIEGVPVKQIGYVTDEPEICLTYEEGRIVPLPPKGFDHFRS